MTIFYFLSAKSWLEKQAQKHLDLGDLEEVKKIESEIKEFEENYQKHLDQLKKEFEK